MQSDPIVLAFFLGYLLLVIAIGWLASRQQKTSVDFIVAGRSLSLWVMVLGNVAAMMHGGAILSHIALAAQVGGVAATVTTAYVLGFAVILFLYARKLRNSGGMTIPDYMGGRFNSRFLRGWSACIVVFTGILVVVGQIKVMGFLFETLLGVPVFWGQLIGTLIFVAYVSMGGLLAVVWTNIAQFLLMWLGLILLSPRIYEAVGGWSQVMSTVEEMAPGWTSLQGVSWTWGFVVSWYILVFVGYSTRLELVTKMFAARDERVARFSIPWTALLVIAFLVFAGMYFGGAARILVWDDIASPDQAFPALVALLAAPWLIAFALTAVASATMSTTDSLLLMSGAAVSHDLVRRCLHEPRGVVRAESFYLRIARLTVLAIGGFAFLVSLLEIGLIWEIIAYSLAIVGSAFFFPLTVGLLSWRIGRFAIVVSSVGGVITSVAWIVLSLLGHPLAMLLHPIVPGLLVAGLSLIVAQPFSRPVPDWALVKFFPDRHA